MTEQKLKFTTHIPTTLTVYVDSKPAVDVDGTVGFRVYTENFPDKELRWFANVLLDQFEKTFKDFYRSDNELLIGGTSLIFNGMREGNTINFSVYPRPVKRTDHEVFREFFENLRMVYLQRSKSAITLADRLILKSEEAIEKKKQAAIEEKKRQREELEKKFYNKLNKAAEENRKEVVLHQYEDPSLYDLALEWRDDLREQRVFVDLKNQFYEPDTYVEWISITWKGSLE